MLVQLSLFALYYRLFEASRSIRFAIYVGTAAVAGFYSAFLAVNLAQCLLRRGWSMLRILASRSCVRPEHRHFYVLSAFNAASDAHLVIIPVRVVWCRAIAVDCS
jgi:hypothetical protein